MSTDRRPVSRLLLASIAAALGVGVALLVLWLVPSALAPFTVPVGKQTVNAKVLNTAPCTAGDPHDRVRYEVGGQQKVGRLQGCGKLQGTQLKVIPPEPGEQFVKRASAGGGTPPAYRHTGFGLLAVSGIAGGAVTAFRPRRRRPRARPRDVGARRGGPTPGTGNDTEHEAAP